VEHYDFEVLEGDEAIVSTQNPRYEPIGRNVILIGVAAALRCAPSFGVP
jgi:hypothetical protein